jgi:hypothetical protein
VEGAVSKKRSKTPRRRIPLARKILFGILVPVIVFTLAEVGLRLCGYGTSFPLFVTEGDRIRTNQTFPRK